MNRRKIGFGGVRLEKRNNGLVAIPGRKLPCLTAEQVRATLSAVRRRLHRNTSRNVAAMWATARLPASISRPIGAKPWIMPP